MVLRSVVLFEQMFLLFLRTHESMEIQFSTDEIHRNLPYCLPTWDQKVISAPFPSRLMDQPTDILHYRSSMPQLKKSNTTYTTWRIWRYHLVQCTGEGPRLKCHKKRNEFMILNFGLLDFRRYFFHFLWHFILTPPSIIHFENILCCLLTIHRIHMFSGYMSCGIILSVGTVATLQALVVAIRKPSHAFVDLFRINESCKNK